VDALATGYGLLEAPCVDGTGGVCFSDVLAGGVHRWSPDAGVETVIPKRRGIGGMCLHADGGLVVSGRDLVHVREGDSRQIFALEDVAGFNDLAPGPDGSVHVGALRFKPFAGEQPVPGEIWKIGPGADPEVLFGGIDWPNGIGFSPDGETLYASDFASGDVLAYDGEAHLFASSPSGDADGLAVDREGGVWVAAGAGREIIRFSPSGDLDYRLEVPADFVSSLCFGGEDARDLYITTVGTLFRARAEVGGLPVPLARVGAKRRN
jgi:sugar lactone lactonase YvrE